MPKLSLGLLLVTYIVFGYIISSETDSWQIWLLSAGLVFLIALGFAAPIKLIRTCFGSLIQTDTRAFISVIFLAFAVVVMFTWMKLFIRLLVLICAGALARLDLQMAEYEEWAAFGVMAVICLGGFALGLVTHQLITGFELPT
ncbi:hypothetical protein [Oscillatoria salina]|uniref:hypothetical protein n=1 Tax=Oscillatoria salina TaxID=331517 RepID=UPI0013B76C08|nr:hypothetical protein [Oscillatoria salina]MBZ8180319.1 hypothetical protein [Oscillatoria salina IIICB1]MEC4892568.1 hypothetical protein [Oscillatoria sp. PMC 1050.18]NET88386.1 hypothetical protein [Kamptonema sp. SIO1D9]